MNIFWWKKTSPHSIFSYDSEKYDSFLDDPQNPLGVAISDAILVLVLIFVISLALETVGGNSLKYESAFFWIDAIISTIFAGEYIFRFLSSKRKIVFPTNPYNIIDMLSFLPFYIELFFGSIASIHALGILRVARIFRLFDFVKHTPLIIQFLKSLRNYGNEYGAILSFTAVIVTIVSFIVYHFENPYNPMFSSIPNSIWWALATITTVGYGDIYPITPLGKFFGSILVLLGPVIVTATASITVIVFMNISKLEKGDEVALDEANTCWRCHEPNILSAKFCMHCGANLEKGKK